MTQHERTTKGRAVLLAVLVALSAITAGAAVAGPVAAQDHDIEVAFTDAEAGTGDEVDVDLELTGAAGDQSVAGYDVTMTFDTDVVEFAGVAGDEFDEPTVNDASADEGEVTFAAQQGDDPEETPLDAATVTFDVIGGEGDVSDVSFERADVQDETATSYALEAVDGSVSVTDGGDATPATFEVSDVEPDDATVDSDETIDISATVENTGDFGGSSDVTLDMDGETVASHDDLELDAGASESVTFEDVAVPNRQGEYEYAVWTDDDSETVPLTVEAAHDVEVVLDDVTAGEGDSVDLELELLSADADELAVGGYEVELAFDPDVLEFDAASGDELADPAVNDDDAADGTVVLQGLDMDDETVETPVAAAVVSFDVVGDEGDVTGVSFEAVEVREDPYTEYATAAFDGSVTVDDEDGASPPPSLPAPPEPGEPGIGAVDADLSDTAIDVGDAVDVTATVENVGDAAGTEEIALTVDGDEVDSESVSLEAGADDELTFTERFDEGGEYEIAVDGVEAGHLTVGAADVQVTDASVSETAVDVGDAVEFTATVENLGDRDGEETVALTIDGDEVDSESVSLEAGETAELTFTHSFDDDGEFEGLVGDEVAGTVTVADDIDDGDDAETDDDGVPGFGAIAAVVALLSLAVAGRRLA